LQAVEGGGRTLIAARTSSSTAALYATDGTAAGTATLRTFSGSNSANQFLNRGLTRSGSAAYFFAWSDSTGWRLFRSDGTAGGTFRVSGAAWNFGGGTGYGPNQAAFGGELFYVALGANSQPGLFKNDGTSSGTVELAAFDGDGSSLDNLCVAGGTL